jgi:NADH-quinone oxidoreductase subunit N
MPSFSVVNMVSIVPEIVVLSLALVILVFDAFVPREKKRYLAYFSVAGLAVAAFHTWGLRGLDLTTFYGMFVLDSYAIFFKMLFYLAAGIAILLSINYVKVEDIDKGEYYALMLFATTGMMIMASGADLISIYLGLELMAMSVYILAGFMRGALKSNEAALKYFLLGAFSSGILLYGISIMYGVTGTTNLKEIQAFIHAGQYSRPAVMLSMILMTAGFGFKVAAVPFHMWVPDVYEGAPTSVTAFMSVGPKAAGFAAFLRVFTVGLLDIQPDWTVIIASLAVMSMLIGNVVAISQTNIKRMLAYSSIAHAGYALIGFVSGGVQGVSSVMLYLFIYAFMNLGAFGVVIMLRKGGMKGEEIQDFAGLAKKNRLAALLMMIFMFSLAGIPPTAGFVGKFYIFMAALNSGYLFLAIIGVIMSAVSAYFYLRVIMVMYMSEPEGEFDLSTSPSMSLAMLAAVTGVLYIGIYPMGLLEFARSSVVSLL